MLGELQSNLTLTSLFSDLQVTLQQVRQEGEEENDPRTPLLKFKIFHFMKILLNAMSDD